MDDEQPRPPRRRSGNRKKSPPPFPVRLSAAERAAIEAAADRAGLTMGSYIRKCVLSTPTTRPRHRAPVDLTALATVLRAFTKVAVNLNQVARHLNMHGIPIPEEMVVLAVRLDEDRVAIMAAMGRA